MLMLLFEQMVVRSEQNAVNCLLAVAVHDLAEDGEDAGAFERVLRARVGDQKTNKAENQVRLGVDPLDLFFKAPDVVSSEKKEKKFLINYYKLLDAQWPPVSAYSSN